MADQRSDPIPDGATAGWIFANRPALFAEAYRMANIWNDAVAGVGVDAIVAAGEQYWLAFRLADGSSDEIAYFSRAEAIRHQLHETQAIYLRLTPDTMAVREAASLLVAQRRLYDQGARLIDPERFTT